jgi:hypothetical protein
MSADFKRLSNCPRVKQILASTCSEVLTQDVYHEFQTKYLEVLLFSILQSEKACLGGEITLAVDRKVDRKGTETYNKAQVVEARLSLQRCSNLDRLVIIVTSLFGEYDFSIVPAGRSLNPPEQVAKALQEQYDSSPDKSGHFTIMLIDNKARTVEYFESNGSETPWLPPTIVVLKQVLASLAESKRVQAASARTRTGADQWSSYDFIEPGDFCPRISWQSILDNNQTCAYWGTLFAVLRLSCSELSRAQLVEAVLEPGKDFLLNLLQKWHCFMWSYVRKTGILATKQLLDKTAKYIVALRDGKVSLAKQSGADRNDVIQINNAIVAALNEANRVWSSYFDYKGARAILAPIVVGLQALEKAAPRLTCAQFQRAKSLVIDLAPTPSSLTRTGRQISETKAATLSPRQLRSAKPPSPSKLPSLIKFLNDSLASNKKASSAGLVALAPESKESNNNINYLFDEFNRRDFYKLGEQGSKTSVDIGNYMGDAYNQALALHQRQRKTQAAVDVLQPAIRNFDVLEAAFSNAPCKMFQDAVRLFLAGKSQDLRTLLTTGAGIKQAMVR